MHESNERWSCAEVFARLDDYMDRELAAEEIDAVRGHLETCSECAREYAFESTVIAELRSKLRRIEVPVHLLETIAQELRHETANDDEERKGERP